MWGLRRELWHRQKPSLPRDKRSKSPNGELRGRRLLFPFLPILRRVSPIVRHPSGSPHPNSPAQWGRDTLAHNCCSSSFGVGSRRHGPISSSWCLGVLVVPCPVDAKRRPFAKDPSPYLLPPRATQKASSRSGRRNEGPLKPTRPNPRTSPAADRRCGRRPAGRFLPPCRLVPPA